MRNTGKLARSVVSAGLGLAMMMGQASPALAESTTQDTLPVGEYAIDGYENIGGANAPSTGTTNLYMSIEKTDLTAPEGTAGSQMRVSIPVAIHYVADLDGNLYGPSDNTVKIVNHTSLGTVHVSNIAVTNAGGAQIVTRDDATTSDKVSLFVRPVKGQSDATGTDFRSTSSPGTLDEFGAYTTPHAPQKGDDWNIEGNHGALALNNLNGHIGGFGDLTPGTSYQIGAIKWSVRMGTRSDADERDSKVTIRFNANNGTTKNNAPLSDYSIPIMDLSSGTATPYENALTQPIDMPSNSVIAPDPYVDANGNLHEYILKGWYTTPTPNTDENGVQRLSDLNKPAKELAGTVQELYAVFVEKQ